MTVNQYVSRYLPPILAKDETALYHMINMLLYEMEKDWKQCNPQTHDAFTSLLNQYRIKGDIITKKMEEECGRPILKKGWFIDALNILARAWFVEALDGLTEHK